MEDQKGISSELHRGRGAHENPANRFVPLEVEWEPGDELSRKTKVFRDFSKSILSKNDSPDIAFTYSVNPYRGCEHGCSYCYARPTHEYLGLSAGVDFESILFAKEDAANLLAKEFSSKKWIPEAVTMSGVTDPYQPVERVLKISRQCLEVFARFRNPVTLITKSALIERDIDLMKEMSEWNGVLAIISITTLDPELSQQMEPRAALPQRRLEAIAALSQAGIPTAVNVAPVIPGLTDHELPTILKEAASAGAASGHYTMVRLPFAVKDLFAQWLERAVPLRKDKVLHRIESIRGGKLNDARFGTRMQGEGIWAEQIETLYRMGLLKAKLGRGGTSLSVDAFRRPEEGQLSLF